MTERCTIEVDRRPDRVVIAPAGEIDYGNVTKLRSVLLDVVRGPDVEVVVDLGRVEFVDSTVLGALVQGKKRLEERGRPMAVTNLTDRVRRTFELAGTLKYLGN